MMERTLRIAWVDNNGNAACIGLDESYTIDVSGFTRESDFHDALRQAEEDAEYQGQCQGVDIKHYQPIATFDS